MEGECERVLQGHAGRVNSIKLCDVKHTAVTVSDDFTARVWDWSTGECRHVLQGHGGWLSDMALLSDASRAVTVSGDDLAVLWDLQEGKCCNVLEGHSAQANSVVLTRRGRYACRARSSHCLCLHVTIFSSVGAVVSAISCLLSSFVTQSASCKKHPASFFATAYALWTILDAAALAAAEQCNPLCQLRSLFKTIQSDIDITILGTVIQVTSVSQCSRNRVEVAAQTAFCPAAAGLLPLES